VIFVHVVVKQLAYYRKKPTKKEELVNNLFSFIYERCLRVQMVTRVPIKTSLKLLVFSDAIYLILNFYCYVDI